MGMLGVRVRNMKASTVKTVLLIACVPLGEKSPHYLLNGGLGSFSELVHTFCRREKDLDLASLTHMYNNDSNDIIIHQCFSVLVPILIIDFFLVVLSSFTSHWATVISFTLSKLLFPYYPTIQHITFRDEKMSLNK
jgi:hypothetical protein